MPNVGFPGGFPGAADALLLNPKSDIVTLGAGVAVLASEDYDGKAVRFRFPHAGCRWFPPEPIIQETDLMGAISLTQFMGQKPYRAEIDVRLDGYPHQSVETDIQVLEHFAEVHRGRIEPPLVTIDGDVPKPHPNLKWRVAAFSAPEEEVVEGRPQERSRYFTTVSLVQYVTDKVLVESLRATSKSKGVKARTETVREGEEWLFEVARRVYKDPSRAGDLATANGLHIGKRLTQGMTLRVP